MSSSVKFLLLTATAMLAACGAEENVVEAEQSAAENTTPAVETVAAITPELGSFGIDLSYQDSNTRPGDDFFRFTNGSWLDTYELPDDRSTHGSFNDLVDRSDARVRTIINDLTSVEPAQDSMEQKVSDYYLSFMNTDVLDELGISPLLPRPGVPRGDRHHRRIDYRIWPCAHRYNCQSH